MAIKLTNDPEKLVDARHRAGKKQVKDNKQQEKSNKKRVIETKKQKASKKKIASKTTISRGKTVSTKKSKSSEERVSTVETPKKKVVEEKTHSVPSQNKAETLTTKSQAKHKGSKPSTMEELLAQTGYTLKGVKRGELIEGQITDISKKMVLIDIGSKTEGMVVDKEYEAAKEYISELAVGDKVTVFVLTPENDRGQILLSLKKAASDRTWEKFEEAAKTGQVVTVRSIDVNRGGVIVRADSLQGFVPTSQFGKQWLGKTDELVDKFLQVRVIEVDREKNRLIFSEKAVSEAEEIKQRAEALKKVDVDKVYSGMVSGIMPFGVFVSVEVPLGRSTQQPEKGKGRLGKVEGLVHISEISWEKVDDPNKHFRVGQPIKVRILGVDEQSGKLNLSVKRLTQDPWADIEGKYPLGKKFKGKVSRVAPFGAFVVLEPGVEGLLHISKIPTGDEPEVNSEIEIFVEQIDQENRRMSLGMVLTEVPVGYK